MVVTNVTAFNMVGLAPSTGTSAGTILEFDSEGNKLPTAGTYNTMASIDTAIASINALNHFWFTDPTLSGTENDFNPILRGTIVYGNSANLDMTTSIWTCPTAGLWQFTLSVFCQAYEGYPSWNLYQNGPVVTLIEQASTGAQWLTSVGLFITPAKADNNGSSNLLMTHHLQ